MSEVTKLGLTEQEMSSIFNTLPDIKLDLSKTREAENRLHEAQHVNPSSYSNLEYVYNESYRELKRNLAEVGYKLTQAEKTLRLAKSEAILDKYQEFVKDKPKSFDTAHVRDAFLNRDEEVIKAQDRIDMLKAVEAILDGKIKVMERTCQYLRKEMDLVIRSGSINTNKYGSR